MGKRSQAYWKERSTVLQQIFEKTRAKERDRASGRLELLPGFLHRHREASRLSSNWKSLRAASLGLRRLVFSILWRCICFERTQKLSRNTGNTINCSQKSFFVCLRRFVEAADLSHKLE